MNIVTEKKRNPSLIKNSAPTNEEVGLGSAGILDSMSRSPRKRNAVDMPGSTAAAEGR